MRSVEHGYGLAGGGYGSYFFCNRKTCSFFFKEKECPVCESRLATDGSCEDCGTPDEIQALMKVIYKQPCGACRQDQKIGPDGYCANVCADGEPCGGHPVA